MLTLAFVAPLQEAKPTPDRSGEPVLKQIMESAAKLRGLHVVISIASRVSKNAVLEPSQTVTLLFDGGNRFNISQTGVWGDGSRFVSDGTTLLIDRMDESASVTLKKAAKSVFESDEGLASEGDPFVYLLAGPSTLDKIVAKDGFIRAFDPSGPEKAVQYKSAKKGTMMLFYLENDKQMLVRRIEYDNKDWLEEQHKRFPDWMDKPDEPLTMLSFNYLSVNGRLPKWAFDTSPPKGMAVVDQRPKQGR